MFNKINFTIMKTLKELNEKCTLIAEFKQPAYVAIEGHSAKIFNRANIAKLYYDNEKYYYLYTKINYADIRTFENMNKALERLNKFIYNLLSI